MILCVGATPAIQRVLVFDNVAMNQVNRAAQCFEGIAGKSVNVAKVLSRLGAPVIATGFHGGVYGQKLVSQLAALGINSDFVEVPQETRVCTTVVETETRRHTELVQESAPVDPDGYRLLLSRIELHLKKCQAVVLSGTITPGGPSDFYERCARLARRASVPCFIDAKGELLRRALPEKPTVVKPNLSELSATVGKSLETEEAILQAARTLCVQGADNVVVTAGAAPTLATSRLDAWRIHSPRIQPVNPIGSGDSFTAGLVLGLVRGSPLNEACEMAAAAGAANALTWMAGDVDPEIFAKLRKETRSERIV